jgi:hypothetical protein
MVRTPIHYFAFEEDFVEDNVRCIPMIVRFKLDASLIKLKLTEWSKMSVEEREQLATMPCDTAEDIYHYRSFLCHTVQCRTGQDATPLPPAAEYTWSALQHIPGSILEKLRQRDYTMSLTQWQQLSILQRFALVKLSTSAHEQKNFPKALQEFKLL